MKNKLLIGFLVIVMFFALVGCETNEKVKDNEKLNDVYNKIGEYFGDENADRSNLGAYYLDTEKNVIVVILIDNNKEKQEEFKKLAKVDSKYLKFVQGGPYGTSNDLITIDELNNINNKIIKYFQSNNVEYKNLSFNYVDMTNKVVVVGLLDNSKEYQDNFKKLVINSDLIVFVQGENLIDHR